MENIVFEYDPKWESVKFEVPTKKIIAFEDVQIFQKRKVHDDYLDFLAKLQEVHFEKL
jgi:hypothetical protein